MKKNNFIIPILTFILCFVMMTGAYGDLGDFNDYDSGYDSGGGYDYGGGYDNDYNYGGNSRIYIGGSGSHSSSGEGSFFSNTLSIVIFIIIVVCVLYSKSKAVRNSGTPASGAPSYSPKPNNITLTDYTDEISRAIIENDPNFSSERFESWVKEVFFTLQTAWSKRDFSAVRPFEKEELYRQHTMQIEQYISAGRINVLERINVNDAYFYRYVRDNDYEYLTVFINARMVDYIKDESTGQVLKGNPNIDSHMKYLYTFMRKTGVLTDKALSNKSTTNCPNCGAPTQITSSGKCEYCDSVITTGDFDWVLSNIEGVKSGVNLPQGGVHINTQ